MKWRKSPPELIALFAEIMPGPPAEPRQMFGYPAGFVNGNMFGGLYQDSLVLRLSDGDRAAFLALPGARVFEPMPGRPMREYVVAPPALLARKPELRDWIGRALKYGASLAPKKKAGRARGAARKKR